jgi:excinuclease UvrABC ATPase subunit
VRGVRGHRGPRWGSADMDDEADAGKPRVCCRACEGDRLAPIPRSVRLGGETYPRFMEKSVSKALARICTLSLTGKNAIVAKATG